MLYVAIAVIMFAVGLVSYIIGHKHGYQEAYSITRHRFHTFAQELKKRSDELMDIYRQEMLDVKHHYEDLCTNKIEDDEDINEEEN